MRCTDSKFELLTTSILWQIKLGQKEHGLSVLAFMTTARSTNQGKRGVLGSKKKQTHGSVEYKTSGWKLSEERRYITFSDCFKAGTFKRWGTRDLHFYQLKQIKRVRVVRRADGY